MPNAPRRLVLGTLHWEKEKIFNDLLVIDKGVHYYRVLSTAGALQNKPPRREPCKWQNRTYQFLQAPGDYRYFIRTQG